MEEKLYISVDEAKKQISGYLDRGKEDDLFCEIILDAQAALETRLQRKLSECVDENGELYRDLKRALKIAVSDYYDNRSDIVFTKPYSLGLKASLTAPFIKFRGAGEE